MAARSSKSTNKTADDPLFTRGDLAKVLDVSPLTIANREKAGHYPEATRDVNGYRIYTLNDILQLQIITFGKIDTRRILDVLYDKGYRDIKQMGIMVEKALSRHRGVYR